MGLAYIDAKEVCKRYFRKGRNEAKYFDAVAPLSMALKPGTLTVLMGRSGSGKSTLLNMLAGLLKPTEGCVIVDGVDMYQLNDDELSSFRNERIGVVPQGHTLLHSLSVVDNVKLPLSIGGRFDNAEEKALRLLAELGLDGIADSYPKELSGGEIRRACIARALIANPTFVCADEPTSDLDDENTAIVFSLLRQAADNGAAVFMVTHESKALAIADQAYRLDAGVLKPENNL